jgi:hypothetical protein
MDIGSPSAAAVAWWDRLTGTKLASGSGSANFGGGLSTAWTYTVPSAHKTQVTFLPGSVYRGAISAGAGYFNVEIALTPNGGSLTVNRVFVGILANVLGTYAQISPPSPMILLAGDVIDLQGYNNDATSGNMTFEMGAVMQEFSA